MPIRNVFISIARGSGCESLCRKKNSQTKLGRNPTMTHENEVQNVVGIIVQYTADRGTAQENSRFFIRMAGPGRDEEQFSILRG